MIGEGKHRLKAMFRKLPSPVCVDKFACACPHLCFLVPATERGCVFLGFDFVHGNTSTAMSK